MEGRRQEISKKNILDLALDELKALLTEAGEEGYRASQVFKWAYGGAGSFSEMKNLPERLRIFLDDEFSLGLPEVLRKQVSREDGTEKFLFGLYDGNAIESVFMKYKYGNSICVSSQAGCRMGCRFCASTVKGLERNLSPGEIIGQVLAVQRETGEKINHLVVMGTGEPFDNYDNLGKFIRLASDPKMLGLSRRNITVSTCGIIPGIERFGEEYPQVNLAISLHASRDEKRSSMMPINNRYGIGELMKAAREYTEKTHRRITFEYTMVSGVNDGDEDLESLVALLKGMLCHVNVIPLNRVEGSGFDTVSRRRAMEFSDRLNSLGVQSTVRRELGADIDAACGQLRLSDRKRIE